jgi:hypothetical protein
LCSLNKVEQLLKFTSLFPRFLLLESSCCESEIRDEWTASEMRATEKLATMLVSVTKKRFGKVYVQVFSEES